MLLITCVVGFATGGAGGCFNLQRVDRERSVIPRSGHICIYIFDNLFGCFTKCLEL